MPAGKYYWHVASHTDTVKHMFSPIYSFVIRPKVTLNAIQVKMYAPQQTFLITTSWFANERKVDLDARLFAGRTLLAKHALTTDNFLIDAKKLDLSTWILPPTVKKGTRLRFVVTLKTEHGAKAAKTKILRAP
jgi:hypothetical protein